MSSVRGRSRVDAAPSGGSSLRAVIEVLAFLCELAQLSVLAIAGWSLGNGGLMSISFAVFYPSLTILIWSLWMAPASSRRLGDPGRLIAQVVLFVATAALASLSGHPALGISFGVIAVVTFGLARLTGGSTGDSSPSGRVG